MEKHLRRAGILVSAGLLIEVVSLLPLHPLAFVGFTTLAVPITGAGIVYFLFSLVSHQEPESDQAGQRKRTD